MTPGDSQLGQPTIPTDMNSSRGNRGYLEGKKLHSDARDCAFFQSHAGFGGRNHSKKYFETIALEEVSRLLNAYASAILASDS
jgi:hypothetical protein